MAEADLDSVIRSMGRKQHQALMQEARKRQAKLIGLSAKAGTKESKARYRQAARDVMLLAAAAARRLSITAENTADSYARAMKKAREDIEASAGPEEEPARKATRKQTRAKA